MEGRQDDVKSTIFGDGELHSYVPVWPQKKVPGQTHIDQGVVLL